MSEMKLTRRAVLAVGAALPVAAVVEAGTSPSRADFYAKIKEGNPDFRTVKQVRAMEDGHRISCIVGDPGERLYAQMIGDGHWPEIYLDGVRQNDCLTADEAQGYVVRHVIGVDGGLAFNPSAGELLKEKAYGRVEISPSPADYLAGRLG